LPTTAKIMRKIYAAAAAVFILHIHAIAQVKIAVKGGLNFSTARAVYADVKQTVNFTTGYSIGAMAKVPFDGVLYFTPSISINKRGFIVKPATGTNKTEQYNIIYLDLTPGVSIYLPHGVNSFSFGFGPNFGITNLGRLKTTNNNNTTSQALKFGYGELGWFDIGLSASLGYHLQKSFIELWYLHGLTGINNNEEIDKRSIFNRSIGLTVGYYFKQTAAR
jgi:Outer membrane protein beta-barrel domain